MIPLNRKRMPAIVRLPESFHVDVAQLLRELQETGLHDPDRYVDIKYSSHSAQEQFLVGNHFGKEAFFKEGDAPRLEGDAYKQLYFTEMDPAFKKTASEKLEQSGNTTLSRSRRLIPGSKHYVPEVDELNYNIINDKATPVVRSVMDMFKARKTRVRLAAIAPGFNIKKHIDYDPTYICRYHVPLVTNERAILGAINYSGAEKEVSLPADGRVYFLNSGRIHWVRNDSDRWRIHLIVDCHGQEDLELLVQGAEQMPPFAGDEVAGYRVLVS